jgi:hypothetical protein
MARTAQDLGYAHPLIGEGVTARAGAKPAGWGDDEFDERLPMNATVTDVAQAEEGYPFGTIEAGGWYWDPKDLIL